MPVFRMSALTRSVFAQEGVFRKSDVVEEIDEANLDAALLSLGHTDMETNPTEPLIQKRRRFSCGCDLHGL
jgi:hypothetical protein